jgi:hypothetical protein
MAENTFDIAIFALFASKQAAPESGTTARESQ